MSHIEKLDPQLLCGRMNAILKNLFFNSKLYLFLVFNVIWIPHPKKYKGSNFHEDWPYRTQVIKILLDTENSKWPISE